MKNVLLAVATTLFIASLPVISLAEDTSTQYDRENAELHFNWQGVGNSINQLPEQRRAELNTQLEKELELDSKHLAAVLSDSAVISAVETSNRAHKSSSKADLLKIDEEWQSIKGFDKAKEIINPDCSKILRTFQGQRRTFAEIFITNDKGLNICQTNMTSDAYQADEDWWVFAMEQGPNKASHGNLEYDESALTYAISIYIPVTSPATGKTIGIAKGVVRRNLEGSKNSTS